MLSNFILHNKQLPKQPPSNTLTTITTLQHPSSSAELTSFSFDPLTFIETPANVL